MNVSGGRVSPRTLQIWYKRALPPDPFTRLVWGLYMATRSSSSSSGLCHINFHYSWIHEYFRYFLSPHLRFAIRVFQPHLQYKITSSDNRPQICDKEREVNGIEAWALLHPQNCNSIILPYAKILWTYRTKQYQKVVKLKPILREPACVFSSHFPNTAHVQL